MDILRLERSREKEGLTKYIEEKFVSKLGYINGFILDLGCGYGFWTKKVESHCRFVIGLDRRDIFSKSKLSRNLFFILGDGHNLPFKDESFEGILLIEVLEHVPKDIEFLREINRVLKKERGWLFPSTPNKRRLYHQIRKIIGKPVNYPLSLGIEHYNSNDIQEQWHFREYSEEELHKLLKDTGFKICSVEGIGLGLGKWEIYNFPNLCERFARTLLVRATKA